MGYNLKLAYLPIYARRLLSIIFIQLFKSVFARYFVCLALAFNKLKAISKTFIQTRVSKAHNIGNISWSISNNGTIMSGIEKAI